MNQNGMDFDKAAVTWDENPHRRALTEAIARAIIERVPLRPETAMLDFGCGTGVLSQLLAEKVGSIVAADASEGMVAELRRKLAQQPELAGKITPRHLASPRGEGLDARAFDLICSAMVFHHLEDVPAVLGQFQRLLRPGGRLAIADLYAEDGSFHGDVSVPHNGFDPAELAETLKNLKFKNIQVRPAHTIVKPTSDGEPREYGIFLLTAEME